MKIYLDFDGTVVEHRFPKIGKYNDGAIEVIKKLQGANHQIVLNTYRADVGDESLNEAIRHLNKLDVNSFLVQPSKIHPISFDMEFFKAKGYMFIDDQCPGTPLKDAEMTTFGLMVDWFELDKILTKHNIY